jgi:hypothetical protein
MGKRSSTAVTAAPTAKPVGPKRNAKGHWMAGSSGRSGVDPGRARKALNADTIREMHLAFARGGRQAIDKVMKQQPAVFLKLLVLLVPRELEVTHSQGVKGLSDEQIAQAIDAIEEMLAKRGAGAKVIEGTVEDTPSASPT